MSIGPCKTPELHTLPGHEDARGKLFFGEIDKDWDFEVKRVYFSTDFKGGTLRGGHAHKNLDQVILCISGAFTVMTDNGFGEKLSFTLDQPGQALRLHSPVWREIKSERDDAIFVVLASQIYTPADYMREYEEFVGYAKGE